jgi:hypothetical protein
MESVASGDVVGMRVLTRDSIIESGEGIARNSIIESEGRGLPAAGRKRANTRQPIKVGVLETARQRQACALLDGERNE